MNIDKKNRSKKEIVKVNFAMFLKNCEFHYDNSFFFLSNQLFLYSFQQISSFFFLYSFTLMVESSNNRLTFEFISTY